MQKKSNYSILHQMPVQSKRTVGLLAATVLIFTSLISYKQAMLELDKLVVL